MEVILSSNTNLGSGYMSPVECGLPSLVQKKNHLTAEEMRWATIMKGCLPKKYSCGVRENGVLNCGKELLWVLWVHSWLAISCLAKGHTTPPELKM